MTIHSQNIVPNWNFVQGMIGEVPEFWKATNPRPAQAPIFKLIQENGQKVLMAGGNGDVNCVGCLHASIPIVLGKTYRMKVEFAVSDDVEPYQNLLFAIYTEHFNDGIFHYTYSEGHYKGENTFFIPGDGEINGEVRIYFKLSSQGKAWIKFVTLEECEAIPPRKARVACVQGMAELENWERVLEFIGKKGVDLVLLPETFRSKNFEDAENIDGPSAALMSSKAKQHRMYVSGTFFHLDQSDGYLYNTGLIMDRNGQIVGRYDKNHPFTSELLDGGVAPGEDVPVFDTDFGKIGMMICYDSWFTDVTELLALKGAEIILFPSAGYYQSIIPARASDNCVRIVASSLDCPMGIWDTSGAEVQNPNADPTRFANCDNTFSDVYREEVFGIKILFASLDLNVSPSPHNWGGPMRSAPGGRRNRREQKKGLFDQIQSELTLTKKKGE
ncbi:carbon-nitrogen hydrolase family protein [Cohnella zeiphila]|uniref:Carbon-nitrogen hydrolase family protein n=1 Tax=Cohnella zeiphila TaxID=2761120 RepID=A0A7X0VWQ7_9BACL|nr:carbon-nitrogen hydrolase family protein [Cohnella zeiphila]MBB6732745.1 carbon-nitrogen hydrolase family protein [Cohnella zeiphila]